VDKLYSFARFASSLPVFTIIILRIEKYLHTLYFKVLSMSDKNQPFETLQDIKRIMERSSRFISLSGLSGVAAGICAFIGTFFASDWIEEYYQHDSSTGFTDDDFQKLKMNLLALALAVLAGALVSAFYFTWRRAKQNHLPVWDLSSKRLVINLLIPLVTGGLLTLAMLQNNEWRYIAPLSMIFYGLSLVNASKFTLSDIRYLGLCEIVLGLINTQFIDYGLYFWGAGFGILHIVYGFIMWWKYERVNTGENSSEKV
jgi:hypothetical protein